MYNTIEDVCKSLFDNSSDSVLVTDSNVNFPGPYILYVNKVFEANTGYQACEVIGKTPRILQGPRTERAVLNKLKSDLAVDQTFTGCTINYTKDGQEIFLHWMVFKMVAFGLTYYVGVQRVTKSDEVVAWIESIKELQEKTLDRLDVVLHLE